MDLYIGSQIFRDVDIPILWGSRAIVQDERNRLAVIDLEGDSAFPEVIGDEPAPGIEFVPTSNGFKVMRDGEPIYEFDRERRTITGISVNLPEIEIKKHRTRVGSNVIQGGNIAGFGVGIVVRGDGFAIGAPLPDGLADLKI